MFRQTLSPSAALRGENGVTRIDKAGGSQTARRPTRTSYRFRQGLRVASVLVPLTLAFATRSFAGEINSSPAFTVLVFNFRQVPSEILAKAKDEVDSILERAGIHAVWRDCPTGDEPCRKGTGTVFFLAIMAGPVQNRFVDTVSGHAVVAEHLAVVYYDSLPRLPSGRASTSDTATILGCVIAHELGHLMLGARGHSITGIMQAVWDFEQTRRALIHSCLFYLKRAHSCERFCGRAHTQATLRTRRLYPGKRPVDFGTGDFI